MQILGAGGWPADMARTTRVIASIAAALLMASAPIAVLADLGVTHAAPVYLLAVVAIGMRGPSAPRL
jgi:hypothetical protein